MRCTQVGPVVVAAQVGVLVQNERFDAPRDRPPSASSVGIRMTGRRNPIATGVSIS